MRQNKGVVSWVRGQLDECLHELGSIRIDQPDMAVKLIELMAEVERAHIKAVKLLNVMED